MSPAGDWPEAKGDWGDLYFNSTRIASLNGPVDLQYQRIRFPLLPEWIHDYVSKTLNLTFTMKPVPDWNNTWVGLLDEHGQEPKDPAYQRQKADITKDIVFPRATCAWPSIRGIGLFHSPDLSEKMFDYSEIRWCKELELKPGGQCWIIQA